MTGICRKVLIKLQNLAQNGETDLCFLGGTTQIALDSDYQIFYDYVKYKDEIHSIVEALVNEGYLKYGRNEFYFSLTHKGLHPYRVQWDIVKRFILTSIVIPIAVSVITTLLTLWINKL